MTEQPPHATRRGPGITATLLAAAGLLGQIAIALGQSAIPLIGVEGWIALLSDGPPSPRSSPEPTARAQGAACC